MAIKLKKTVKSFSNNYVNDDVLSRLKIHLGRRYDLVPDSPTETKNGLIYGGVLAYKKGSKHSLRDLMFNIGSKDYIDYGPNEKLKPEIDEIVKNSFEEVNKKFSSTKPAWDELENCIKENCSEPIKKLIEAGESQDKIKDTVNYLIDHIMEGDGESREFSDDKVIEVKSVRDLLDKSEKNVIDRLKKEFKSKYSSSITIKFGTGWYWHIHIYHDMHRMEIGLVKTNSENWPSQDEWENNSRHLELDDRYSKDQLIDKFLNWVE